MSTVPRPDSRAGSLESHGHVAGSQRIGKPIIYSKNPAFIGCFGISDTGKIADVAECLDTPAAAMAVFGQRCVHSRRGIYAKCMPKANVAQRSTLWTNRNMRSFWLCAEPTKQREPPV